MKIIKTVFLINAGPFHNSDEYKSIFQEISQAIATIENPIGSGKFNLNPVKHGNGVTRIKKTCMKHLKSKGWILEERVNLATRLQPGPVDAVKHLQSNLPFALEWETGNISSTHRALNKMVLGLIDKKLSGGMLILPSQEMYPWLTDRIGNFDEIEPYFPIFKHLKVKNGILSITVIEQDELSKKAPLLRKGQDGNSKKRTPSISKK
jgi:hypothetical protein